MNGSDGRRGVEAPTAAEVSQLLEWKLSQVFGERTAGEEVQEGPREEEVITSAEFHPTHCNMLAYSSSKGSIHLIDMRQFEEQEAPGSRSFFTEMIASISDIKFAKDGRHILGRDYMTLKLEMVRAAYLK
ncbi:Serine/threonine-protein phosphatase 2A 55 kDa regulatory subunit B [Quillaja saponaria]|uniref:Serine/threonine-protein phosphatase 2A 55 kDa regulatory subunit B n=1 Tax=Quillaja saponaria TaxID=32244 RepID=A0AAD7LHP3_QUISA|nr:Serine/threonine-protein phosphatase 2A 55 kDa regulatory subunit B [Quillaja saponaria]